MADYNITFIRIGVEAGIGMTLGLALSSNDDNTGEAYYWLPWGESPASIRLGNLTSGDNGYPIFQPQYFCPFL